MRTTLRTILALSLSAFVLAITIAHPQWEDLKLAVRIDGAFYSANTRIQVNHTNSDPIVDKTVEGISAYFFELMRTYRGFIDLT